MSRYKTKMTSSHPSAQVTRILLVNDNPTQLDAMSLLLRFEGYTVYTAENGEVAITLLRDVTPDLIVSDVVMPGIDGIRLCRRIKSNPDTAGIPILLVTGLRFDDSGVVEGFEAGADDYLEMGGPSSLLLKKIELLIGQSRDRRSKERAEEAIRQQKSILEFVIEASVDGILVVSPEGKIVAFNKRFAEMWGVDERQLGSLTDKGALHSVQHRLVDPQELLALFDHLRDHPYEQDRGEVILKDGRVFDRYTSPILDPDGESNGRVWFFRDLTEKRHLEEQLRQSQKMEAVGRLAGGIAHDFNNLLTAIIGYSQVLLRKDDLMDSMRGPIEEIEKAGQRAASLTSQLMVFSRKQVLQPKVLDLNMVVRGIEKMIRRLIGEHITVETSLSPDLGRVRADPGQIEQIIVNLAVNARDAMPRGGTLVIETANVDFDQEYIKHHIDLQRGPYVMLSLSDNGVGMDLQTLAHIFEPFFTTKEVGRGTGLGLATVYAIVKTCGGSVWVYSEPGQGTTFKVYLPRVEVPADKESYDEPGESPKGSETILLVEDDETVRRLARSVLQMNGYDLLEATNGEEALMRYEQHTGPIHLVLTDVVMPQMNGSDLVTRVRFKYPDVKALFMSGYTANAILDDEVMKRGVAFLQKPFSAEVLLRKVREVLDKP
ncbi:MAG TPA: response regulator [Blastocatellia bacterium]|nr:response regulator [Blastocatellia bacterium]